MFKSIPISGYGTFIVGNHNTVSFELSGKTLRTVNDLLSDEAEPWHGVDINDILLESNAKVGLPHKVFMTILRHALSGMKVRVFFCVM